jgi:hypothetical protein
MEGLSVEENFATFRYDLNGYVEIGIILVFQSTGRCGSPVSSYFYL